MENLNCDSQRNAGTLLNSQGNSNTCVVRACVCVCVCARVSLHSEETPVLHSHSDGVVFSPGVTLSGRHPRLGRSCPVQRPVNQCLCTGKSKVEGHVFPVAHEMAVPFSKLHFLRRQSQQKSNITRSSRFVLDWVREDDHDDDHDENS